MKSIVITGASGYLGKRLLDRLSDLYQDCEIFALFRNTPINKSKDNITPIKVDLSKANDYRKLPLKFDKLLHLAGDKRTFLRDVHGIQQFEYNNNLTKLMVDYLKKSTCNSLVFASSVYIYSGTKFNPFNEDNINLPKDYLGLSKLTNELYLKSHSLRGNFSNICLRIFTTYGANLDNKQFVSSAIHRLRSNSKKEKFFNPHVYRDFIHIDDVVEAFVRSIKLLNQKCENYFKSINIATGKSTTIKDLILEIIEFTETDKEIEFIDGSHYSNDIDHFADIKKMKSLFNWVPKIELSNGLGALLSENG